MEDEVLEEHPVGRGVGEFIENRRQMIGAETTQAAGL